jgi:Peptidase family M28/Peptidase family M1 domain/PDZ domain
MKYFQIIIMLLVINSLVFAQKSEEVYHHLNVKIDIETTEIFVRDSMVFEEKNSEKAFYLNAVFEPICLTKNASIKKVSTDKETEVDLEKWVVKSKSKTLVVSYSGIINVGLEAQGKEEYQRGFSETSGTINEKGVYLAGSTYWVPSFDNKFMVYSLSTELPKEWSCVSQGKRTRSVVLNNKHYDTWVCEKPQEEVYLIAAAFNEYVHDMNSGIKAMAFLRTPDEGIANKYLEVTEQYMDMYQEMIGAYPYSKFALVENFWETGYGMPSFTLLGEKIIRFPFILHSSYPHELLHNWWGNSIYVNYQNGNWCEGTTVYMADHLIKEQRGAGEEYRRSTLQNFTNFVTEEADFPLNKFINRYDGPSSAIGYGKGMMLWHMLRRKLGDEVFLNSFKLFNENNKFKFASYTDIRLAFEEVSGLDLKSFFNQWVERTGAPQLGLKEVIVDMYGNSYRVKIILTQKQKSNVFDIDIPIGIATRDGIEHFVFNMNSREQEYQMMVKSKPLKLVVDPQYDIFRILDPSEVPPTLSKIWGSEENVLILPSNTNKAQLEIYQSFADAWANVDSDGFEIISDKDINELPKDKTAWIMGFENKFAEKTNKELLAFSSGFNTDSMQLSGNSFPKKNHSFIFTLSKESDINQQNIFIAINNKEAIAGLIRKLPHYGKYSYLAFSGNEPTNCAKGEWSVVNSPLVAIFEDGANKLSVYEPRKALATLRPVFSEKRMMATIEYLASAELKGRGIGTPEIDDAAEYIANKFKEAGLSPINNDGYYQKFSYNFEGKGEVNLTNVIGVIPGTDPKLKEETVVISAHYDHLGFGWPDVHKGDEGKIHFGADDNASGVAILIELAQTLGKTIKPKRTIVFLACTAEEAGLVGSRYYVEYNKNYFKGNIFANVNLDTDGSLFDKNLLVLNGNSAKEWKFIFMGTDYTTGVKSEVIEQELDASDQVAFIEKGIPGIQLFTGATENYHKPSDTYDKIDGKGLVKVATVTKEVILYLAYREDPMTFTGSAKIINNNENNNKTDRKVGTGSIPDFTYQGEGVKISSLVEGSCGEKAGLKAGDIILGINDKEIKTLKEYSECLKQFKVEDTIILKLLRGDENINIDLTLEER